MLNMEESPEIVLPIQGLRNIKAIAHDAIDGHIYWIDGRTKTIKRALDNGTDVSCQLKMHSTLLGNLIFDLMLKKNLDMYFCRPQ